MFKIAAPDTDASAMSDTAVTPSTETPTLQPHPETAVPATPPAATGEIDAPRLGAGPIAAPAPIGVPTAPNDDQRDDSPVETESSVAAAPTLPTLPVSNEPVATPKPEPQNAAERFELNALDLDAASLPTLPDVAAAPTPMVVEEVVETGDDETGDRPSGETEAEHPMAHLMPKKSKPTEASIRAAEQRAIKKAKAKKIKIGVFVGALAVSALAGPPFVSWLTGAINESGSTSTESGE